MIVNKTGGHVAMGHEGLCIRVNTRAKWDFHCARKSGKLGLIGWVQTSVQCVESAPGLGSSAPLNTVRA